MLRLVVVVVVFVFSVRTICPKGDKVHGDEPKRGKRERVGVV